MRRKQCGICQHPTPAFHCAGPRCKRTIYICSDCWNKHRKIIFCSESCMVLAVFRATHTTTHFGLAKDLFQCQKNQKQNAKLVEP